jgi:hypothetical protein
MSNTRKIKTRRQPPRCADCNAVVRTTTGAGGRRIVRVAHDRSCPAWHGTVPSSTVAYAMAAAAAGQRVLYVRTPALPEGWPA